MPDPHPNARPIPFHETLGCLRQQRYNLFGWCSDCAALYRKDMPPGQRVRASFDIDLEKLIAERGADATCIRMPPIPCPRCSGRQTEYRIFTKV